MTSSAKPIKPPVERRFHLSNLTPGPSTYDAERGVLRIMVDGSIASANLELRSPNRYTGNWQPEERLLDLDEINQAFGAAVSKVFNNKKLSVDKERDALFELAQLGRNIYTSFFPAEARDSLMNWFQSNPDQMLEISSSNYQIPWQLLYTEDPLDDLHINHFLGAIVPLIRRLPRTGHSYESSAQVVTSPLKVKTARDESLRGDTGGPLETDVFKAYGTNPKFSIETDELRDLKEKNGRPQEISEVRSFFKNEDKAHLYHLCCHGTENGDRAPTFELTLSEHFRVTPIDIVANGGTIENEPVVFLNACSAGTFGLGAFQGISDHLLSAGVRTIIGPDFPIEHNAAMEAARLIYRRMKRSERAAHAVRSMTMKLARRGDISGLLYGVYGQGDVFWEPGSPFRVSATSGQKP